MICQIKKCKFKSKPGNVFCINHYSKFFSAWEEIREARNNLEKNYKALENDFNELVQVKNGAVSRCDTLSDELERSKKDHKEQINDFRNLLDQISADKKRYIHIHLH